MSAVKEWFGAYNIVFRHIRETYGAKEMDRYLLFLADEANSDISLGMKDKPVKESSEMVRRQFQKGRSPDRCAGFGQRVGHHCPPVCGV